MFITRFIRIICCRISSRAMFHCWYVIMCSYLRCGTLLAFYVASLVATVIYHEPTSVAAADHSHLLATQWARTSIQLPSRHDYGYSEFDFSVDGSRIAYFSPGRHPRGEACDPTALREIKLLDLRHSTSVVIDQLPTPAKDTCLFYTDLKLVSPWLLFSVWRRSASISEVSFYALNLLSRTKHLLAVSPRQDGGSKVVEQITNWQTSRSDIVWSIVKYLGTKSSTSVAIQSLESSSVKVLVSTPWFNTSDQRAWGVRDAYTSGVQVVWTRTTPISSNIVYYNLQTRKTFLLTRDDKSFGARINGNIVAWIVRKGNHPQGVVRVYDLHTRIATDMPGALSYNLSVGQGLISWMAPDDISGAVPLYFVKQHALRYYQPTAAEVREHAQIPDVQVFGREVLVPIILHADRADRIANGRIRLYRLDSF